MINWPGIAGPFGLTIPNQVISGRMSRRKSAAANVLVAAGRVTTPRGERRGTGVGRKIAQVTTKAATSFD